MNHLSEIDLALYSSGDLSFLQRWKANRHVKSCADCARELDAFRTISHIAANTREQLPEDVAWGHLAAEMKANIHVALEAGKIAGPMEEPVRIWRPWHAVAAFASVVALVVSGFVVTKPASPTQPVSEMTLVGSDARLGTVSGNVEGGSFVRQRRFNPETGEQTTLIVYAQ